MDRRQRKTREAVVDAFRRLFFEHGYDGVSVGAVAAAADVGRSTLYTHYRRKEDLLLASMEMLLAVLADAVSPGDDEELARLMRHFWDNRRHRAIFSPGACRNVLAAALSERIEARLCDPAHFGRARWRVPVALAARLIADHQLNLLDRWLSSHNARAPATMAAVMRDSVGGLCATLRDAATQRGGNRGASARDG